MTTVKGRRGRIKYYEEVKGDQTRDRGEEKEVGHSRDISLD